ncbi:phage tail protein [Pseudomonas sp. NBRC 111142]|uniref:phage tail protein n=2 Tax=unclassified Pseudomonas TaxID=196821 RepID=UPI0006D4758B|nr:phage tail protein [Pseudomonas sp. NBRC 111142]
MADQNTQFYAILTNVGAAKQANADALGIPWKITQLGVGDANGIEPTPNATQTRLINEWRRAPLNQLKVDEKNNAIIVAEQVIPAEVGGKWIREIALYDADGDMVAVANCPPTYKPLLNQGSGRTQVVRMNLLISSSSNVELKIDPSVVLATREYVDTRVIERINMHDVKQSVRVATTVAIELIGLQQIDGVQLAAGDRVLVKDQTDATKNWIYTAAVGVWPRALDANTSAVCSPAHLIAVHAGTINASSVWQLSNTSFPILGSTPLVFRSVISKTVVPGIYGRVQVDALGRVTAGSWNPTTLAGFGIIDAPTKVEMAKAISDALKLPLAALDYPTVATPDGRLSLVATAQAGGGGTVSVPAGVNILLAEADVAGELGQPRVVKTTAWTSAALPVNSQLFLRANFQAGALTLYTAPGTDSDAVPASYRSSAGQASSGFDSTSIDILLAKVVTGAAGSKPAVVALANKKALEAVAFWAGASGGYTLELNWARTPRAYVASFTDFDDFTKSDYSIVAEPVGTNSAGVPIGTGDGAKFSDRYYGRVGISAYIPTGTIGPGKMNARVRWQA